VLDVRVGRRAVGDDGAVVLDVRVGRRAVGDLPALLWRTC